MAQEGSQRPASALSEGSGPEGVLRATVPPYRLGELLLAIAEQQLTGRLRLVADVGERTVFFHSGFPVFSQSSQFAERLGAVGVRQGILSRDHVAKALSLSREREIGLGEALLEHGMLQPKELYGLLGVQLRDVLVACCGSASLRVRFAIERAALRHSLVLRLHPMTVVLGFVMSLAEAERRLLADALDTRRVVAAPLPALVSHWLDQVGLAGSLDSLADGGPLFASLRQRLLVRMRPAIELAFDGSRVRPGVLPKTNVARADTSQAAELIGLSLVLSGAIRLEPRDIPPAQPDEPAPSTSSAAALLAALDAPPPRLDIPAWRPTPASEADRAITAYLFGKAEREIAASTAVWGPAVEALDPALPSELAALYLELKPQREPQAVLGVGAEATTDELAQAYAKRTELVTSLGKDRRSLHVDARCSELLDCIDSAFERLLGSGRSMPPPAAPEFVPDDGFDPGEEKVMIGSTEAQRSSAPPVRDAAAQDAQVQALISRVTALLRQSDWRAVLELLGQWPPQREMPFLLQLARAMAQRELARPPSRPSPPQHWVILGALLVGVAIGWLAALLGGL